MRKDIRIAICLVVIILLVILCAYRLLADKEIDEDKAEVTPTSQTANYPTQPVYIIPSNNQDVVLKRVKYYKVSLADSSVVVAETAVGSDVEITPSVIAEYVSDALDDEELEVNVIEVVIEDKKCIIDLGNGIKSVSKRSAETERLVLDAFSMSIIDNCREIDEVTFRLEGKAYVTDNIRLGESEGYLKR